MKTSTLLGFLERYYQSQVKHLTEMENKLDDHIDKLADECQGEWAMGDYKGTTVPMPPAYDKALHMQTCTEFRTTDDPRVIIHNILQVLKRVHGECKVDRCNYTIKCQVHSSMGSIRFYAEVEDVDNDDINHYCREFDLVEFPKAVYTPLYVVSFRRIKNSGTSALFHKLYTEVVERRLDPTVVISANTRMLTPASGRQLFELPSRKIKDEWVEVFEDYKL